MDNRIAAGKTRPFIIVMPYGMTNEVRPGAPGGRASFGSHALEGGRSGPPGGPRVDAEALTNAGINSVFYVSPNSGHEFLSWRRSLREMAPLLFRD